MTKRFVFSDHGTIISLFLALCALYFFQGCKKEDQTMDQNQVNELKLTGTWRSDVQARIIRFTSDHEFVDSLFYPSIKKGNQTYVLHGHYTLDDDYIYLDNLSLSYFYLADSTGMIRAFFYSNPRMRIVSLFYGKVELAEVKVLTPEDPANPDKLTGKWSTVVPVSAFDQEQTPHYVTGGDQRVYDFSPDSSYFALNHILQFGNTTIPYSFDHIPYMLTEEGYYNLGGDIEYISFKDNVMYMQGLTYKYDKVGYQ